MYIRYLSFTAVTSFTEELLSQGETSNETRSEIQRPFQTKQIYKCFKFLLSKFLLKGCLLDVVGLHVRGLNVSNFSEGKRKQKE